MYGVMWNNILDRLIEREGGLIDHPFDKGGVTKYGITLPTLCDYKNNNLLSHVDIEQLTIEQAKEIYWFKWINHSSCKYNLLPVSEDLREAILDTAILFGRNRANKWVQSGINSLMKKDLLLVDGVLGEQTRVYIAQCFNVDLIVYIVLARIQRHCNNCVKDKSQLAFLNGWYNRAAALLGDRAP